ncbi:TetR/AcrR family transcriptional regulator [Ktedonobacter robiniae]|uniref:TetR family transcriptional regulator n=1 Tax=Ktedonobacter robiniae TaxID=2778365 RepID=A0ABQ3UZ70_9CHLR|nr:TetR/AcrR family transcriptional regulator [Ktedonobacter robiniae]GHO58189.1 TetR family transcriptional regulator [Ktedonobacter robiniae]
MEDRRVQRTRQLLERALLELIEEHNYESITVQQITDRANMGRATFYLHYHDKEQLLSSTLQKLQKDLAQRLEPLRPSDLLTEEQTLSEKVFEHVGHYRHLYQVLLSERGAALAKKQLIDYMTQQAEHFIVNPLLEIVSEPAVPAGFLATYLSGTLYTAISWWLNHQQQKTPEEMGLLMRKLTVPAMFSALGIDPTRK